MEIVGILTNKQGITVGARLRENGVIRDFTLAELKAMSGSIVADNAIVDKNGHAKAKPGRQALPKICNDVGKAKQANSTLQQSLKLLSNKEIILYHGNKDKTMKPQFGVGSSDNDFGSGFYTTNNLRLAREWAWSKYTSGSQGYVHSYTFNLEGLNVLNFCALDSLHWAAEIISNRQVNLEHYSAAKLNRAQFLQLYKIDTSAYDILVGYRADDSYFNYAAAFLGGALMREDLDEALYFGELGLQVCLKSKKAYSQLQALGLELAPKGYAKGFSQREFNANNKYRALLERNSKRSIAELSKLHRITDYLK